MTDSDMNMTDIFSKVLLHYKTFDHFDGNINGVHITSKGHGPFCQLENSGSIYDLRLNAHRWAYGHSHPLYIKSLAQQLDQSLPSAHSNKVDLTRGPSLIGADSRFKFCYFSSDLYEVLNQLNIKKVFFVDELLWINRRKREKIVNEINSCSEEFILIEKNLVNYHISGNPVLESINTKPSFYISNYSLPSYCIYSNQSLNSSGWHSDIYTGNFINMLQHLNILGEDGAISRRQEYLKKNLNNAEVEIFGSCIIVSNSKNIFDKYSEKGLLSSICDDSLVFNLPITLKQNQLEFITEKIKELI